MPHNLKTYQVPGVYHCLASFKFNLKINSYSCNYLLITLWNQCLFNSDILNVNGAKKKLGAIRERITLHAVLDRFGVCLIGANSENGRLGRLGICVLIDYQIPQTAGLAGLEGLPNLLLQQALADFGEILVFICETLKTRRICSCCYGD